MANMFSQLFNLFGPGRKAPIYVPEPSPPRTPLSPPVESAAPAQTLPPMKNWSHPFKDKSNPLLQLTQLAKAAAGYYPLGRNGLWHGGVHFDSGTAGTLEQQSSVHCLADGEVVAYRIDEHSPTTTYFVDELCIPKPFSRNFVLVRHRLEAPKIEGSTDVPPSLIFYSLCTCTCRIGRFIGMMRPSLVRRFGPTQRPGGSRQPQEKYMSDFQESGV